MKKYSAAISLKSAHEGNKEIEHTALEKCMRLSLQG